MPRTSWFAQAYNLVDDLYPLKEYKFGEFYVKGPQSPVPRLVCCDSFCIEKIHLSFTLYAMPYQMVALLISFSDDVVEYRFAVMVQTGIRLVAPEKIMSPTRVAIRFISLLMQQQNPQVRKNGLIFESQQLLLVPSVIVCKS